MQPVELVIRRADWDSPQVVAAEFSFQTRICDWRIRL
jgi:hypothetical protein